MALMNFISYSYRRVNLTSSITDSVAVLSLTEVHKKYNIVQLWQNLMSFRQWCRTRTLLCSLLFFYPSAVRRRTKLATVTPISARAMAEKLSCWKDLSPVSFLRFSFFSPFFVIQKIRPDRSSKFPLDE